MLVAGSPVMPWGQLGSRRSLNKPSSSKISPSSRPDTLGTGDDVKEAAVKSSISASRSIVQPCSIRLSLAALPAEVEKENEGTCAADTSRAAQPFSVASYWVRLSTCPVKILY